VNTISNVLHSCFICCSHHYVQDSCVISINVASIIIWLPIHCPDQCYSAGLFSVLPLALNSGCDLDVSVDQNQDRSYNSHKFLRLPYWSQEELSEKRWWELCSNSSLFGLRAKQSGQFLESVINKRCYGLGILAIIKMYLTV